MGWRIHTGPFPFIVPDHDGELWHWRITDGAHFTSVTVNISGELLRAEPDALPDEARRAVGSRGRSAVAGCLDWEEPPREICFPSVDEPAVHWGGAR